MDEQKIRPLVWNIHTERWEGQAADGEPLKLEAEAVHEVYTRVYDALQEEMAPREAARIACDVVFRADLLDEIMQHPDQYGAEADWCGIAHRWPWAAQGA